jgi:hypothetical protein
MALNHPLQNYMHVCQLVAMSAESRCMHDDMQDNQITHDAEGMPESVLDDDDRANWRYKRTYIGAQDDPNMREFYFIQVCIKILDMPCA